MNPNSLDAFAHLPHSKKDAKTIALLAQHGPASQAELIQACCTLDPEFIAMDEAQRVKAGQTMYGRLHRLKKLGIAIITGTKPDPWTGNTVDVYALNPNPPVKTVGTKISLKKILASLEDMEFNMRNMGDVTVSTIGVANMLKAIRGA